MTSKTEVTVLRAGPDMFVEDENALSLSYFCKLPAPILSNKHLINDLKNVASERKQSCVRFCLHSAPSDFHHDMILLLTRENYCRPHLHLKNGDVHHVIEGRSATILFDDDGNITSANVLDVGDIFRIGLNVFHAVVPISTQTIFHESRMGPFKKDADTKYPSWAPDGSDNSEALDYTQKLYAILENEHGIHET